MITAIDTNLSLLNKYLADNQRRNRTVDKSRITRLQSRATSFDPLLSQEQDTQHFSTVESEPKERELKCCHCGNVWTYKGRHSRGYTLCKCGKPVRLHPVQLQKKQAETS